MDIMQAVRKSYEEFAALIKEDFSYREVIGDFLDLETNMIFSELSSLPSHSKTQSSLLALMDRPSVTLETVIFALDAHFEYLQREIIPVLRKALRAEEREDLARAYDGEAGALLGSKKLLESA